MRHNYKYLGREIKKIREHRNMTQKELAQMVGMSVETIRRIENNYNNPRIDSFIDILDALGIDFDIMLMEDEGSSWDKIDDIIKEIDNCLENTDLTNLKGNISKLESFIGTLPDSYEIKLNQYIYFYKAIYEKRVTNDYGKYKKYLLHALDSGGKIDFSNCKKSINGINARILISLSEYYINKRKLEKGKEILDYLLEYINTSDRSYINLLYNLARYYYIIDDYEESLDISIRAIILSSRRNDYKRIILLYYLKGLSMYKLGYKHYKDELEKSLLLCDLFLKDNLRKNIEESIKNIII